MTEQGDLPVHDDMSEYEERKAREAWESLPENPAYDDFLMPVGEYETPAYVNFPDIRRRFASRRAAWLAVEYDIVERAALALAARQANCSLSWVADEIGVTEATVKTYLDRLHDEFGHAILTQNVPPASVDSPLVVGEPNLRECPNCGKERILGLQTVDMVFRSPSKGFRRAQKAGRAAGETHICSSCHATFTIDVAHEKARNRGGR